MYNILITCIVLHCSAHWQMAIILPKENVVIWFCSLHNRPDNYLKGIINKLVLFFNTFALALVGNINILIVQYPSMFVQNNALKGLDDTSQSKSKATARSSTEAKYRSIAQISTELTWIHTLLTELQVSFTTPVIFCDNQSAVSIAHNPVFHSRTKHMKIDIFFVREKILAKYLTIVHVPVLK